MKDNLSLKNRKVRNSIKYLYLAAVALFSIATIASDVNVVEDEIYTDRDHIVMYIYEYDDLPSNYIPKDQQSTVEGEDLFLYDVFRNDEELLPLGETYTEAYINATKTVKGKERLVYSDEIVYYTSDHYESFEIVATEDILSEYRGFLITTSIFTVATPAAVAILIKRDDELSYAVMKDDIKEDYKYVKKLLYNAYTKVKNKVLEITE